MIEQTIKNAVLNYLEGRGWVYGGTICRDVAGITQHKESVVERHGLRGFISKNSSYEKQKQSPIEFREVPNPNGKGANVYQYRLKSEPTQVKLI